VGLGFFGEDSLVVLSLENLAERVARLPFVGDTGLSNLLLLLMASRGVLVGEWGLAKWLFCWRRPRAWVLIESFWEAMYGGL
jgi:hypothetical protein